jgi:glycosyltransferase involved in cell wall biosynthesis
VIGLLAGGEVPGDEIYAQEVIPRIKALESTGRFRWLGHLEPVEPFMHALDIFVSTSEYETFGMSVLEAMACGNAIAAYRAGSVYEVVGPAGLVVETGNYDGLLSMVESLVLDHNLRRHLGDAAKRRVAEEFSANSSMLQLKQLYESLI